jgi:predicted DNA-binding WGR domain protein/retron-type reverse transcriptase
MGLRDWLKRLWYGTRKRDVSRLGGEDLDAVEELVDLSGGPLKPNHLRRALRDRRLVPKRKPVAGYLRKHKPRVFSRSEAARLFAATLRTSNRNLRDLAPDEEQLARYGLPAWKTEADVAAALGISVGELRFFSIHRDKERVRHYLSFAIPKRSGGERLIQAPKPRLKALQRRLLPLLVNRLPASDAAHGFRSARSIRSGAEPHLRQRVLVQMDLADFFPTVTYPRVRGLFIALGYSYPVAATLAALATESERQPVDVDGTVYHVPVTPRHCVQGAPTSPGICNAVVVRMDRRLGGLARWAGFRYTRYADDLTFSGDDPRKIGAILVHARRIVEAEGFRINDAKTRVSRRGQRQVVTGVTVNDVLGLSRRERRRLRARIHHVQSEGLDPVEEASIEGYLSYLHMLNPGQAEGARARWARAKAVAPRLRDRRPAKQAPPAKPSVPERALDARAASAASVSPGRTRRFEFIGGTSRKYWQVTVEGRDLVVSFGRIGTVGQQKRKSFASEPAARKAAEALISEKLGKGYREVDPA